MSTLLNNKFALNILFVLVIACTEKASAQCATSVQTGDELIVTSIENYQYSRTSAGYYSLLITTTLTKDRFGKAYSLKIVYAGNIAHANPGTIALKNSNNAIIIKQLKREKVIKTDDPSIRSQAYTVNLSSEDVEQLKNNSVEVIEVRYNNGLKPVNIKINDPDFLKNQMSCITDL